MKTVKPAAIEEIDQRWAMLAEIAKYEREGIWRPIEELRERHRLLSDIAQLERQINPKAA